VPTEKQKEKLSIASGNVRIRLLLYAVEVEGGEIYVRVEE
jgi:hypothetical protein